MVYVIEVCRQLSSSEKLLMMDRGIVRNMQFSFQNKFEKLVHLVGFIIRLGPPIHYVTKSNKCAWRKWNLRMTVASLHLESPFCHRSVVEKTSLSQRFVKFI
jgi:hypothetical protein